MNSSAASSSSQGTKPSTGSLLSSARLQELLISVAGSTSSYPSNTKPDKNQEERLDPIVETALLRMADEFAVDVVKAAVEVAAHRRSACLQLKDVRAVVEGDYYLNVPRLKDEDDLEDDDEGAGAGTNKKKGSNNRETNQQQDVHQARMSRLRQAPHNRQ